MLDLSISCPTAGTIRLDSCELFAEPETEQCQEFLRRLLEATPVRSVVMNVRRAAVEIGYCVRTATRQQTLRAIEDSLKRTATPSGSAGQGKRGPNGPERSSANGASATSHGNGNGNGNGHGKGGARDHGGAPTMESGPGQGATRVRWRPDERGELRLFRHGSQISSWEIKHELPGRLRLKHPALHRRAEICQAIERELMSVLGVENYKTNPLTSSLLVVYNEQQIRREQVVEILDGVLHRVSLAGEKDRPSVEFALCSLSVPLAATAQFLAPPLLPVAAGLFLYTSVRTFKEAYQVLFQERRLGVDVLDAIVVMSCLGTGQIFAGSVLCWCLSFGRTLVKMTQDNSKKMLMSVFGKQPRFVWLCRDGVEEEVPLEKVQQGDVIVINTGEAVPVDGIVTSGMGMVDQAALTGESTPAEKVVGERVFASTLLVAGKIYVTVEKAGSETTSAKIAGILNDTASYKLESQNKGEKLADKAVIPTLAIGSVALGLLGPAGATAVLNSDFGTGIRMAAPLAMLSSLTLCAQHGILVKDGRAMDLMTEIDTVLFDKTGTLTREIPEVGRVLTCSDLSAEQILTYAAAAEHRFAHPIAKAILAKFAELKRPLPTTDESKYNVGFGITVELEGRTVRVGSGRFMKMEGIAIPGDVQALLDQAHGEGFSLVMVGVDDKLGGAIELRASHRPEAQAIVSGLRKRGIDHLAIISGDHDGPTRKLAESLGMDEYFAGVLPGDKADYVERLQKQGRKVCFVGDGINDSIALKKANVSVSLRGATSIATDTAQVVFMEESLAKLCDFVDISRQLDRNVRSSWGMIIVPNALCIAGAFTMGFGVMASVVTNNVAAIGALVNGLMPLREVSRLQAQKDLEHTLQMAAFSHRS